MQQSRRPSGLALAVPPLPRRRSSLLSLDSAASPHTPRSCASGLPPPDVYLQPAISKRTSTTSWNSSNADDMDFDWKPDQVLLLSRTLDALPAHLVTPFHGPIPPSNLLDKIARGVSQAKGPLDWPHSIRATRVKLIELAKARAKDDSATSRKKREQPHPLLPPPKVVVDADPATHLDYFADDPHQTPIHPDDAPQRRPLYKQSSMDFIQPDPAEIRDNPTIAQLSTRLQRTERAPSTITSTPPVAYHPYKAKTKTPSRIAVPRSRTIAASPKSPSTTMHTRDTSPPPASAVPDLIVPNPNSLSNSSSNSSFSSSSASASASGAAGAAAAGAIAGHGLRAPLLLRRLSSSSSSISMYSSSSAGSGRAALQDKRLQRVREEALPPSVGASGGPGTPPAPPPKDRSVAGVQIGTKRAPSYGALALAYLAGGRDKEKEKSRDKENAMQQQQLSQQQPPQLQQQQQIQPQQQQQPKHTRDLSSGSAYPSSDEEEKARAKRAKKLRSGSGAARPSGAALLGMGSPGGIVPPSPSVVSLSSSSVDGSSSASGSSADGMSSADGPAGDSASVFTPGTPTVPLVPTAPCTPQHTGAGIGAAPTPPAKDRFLGSPVSVPVGGRALRAPSARLAVSSVWKEREGKEKEGRKDREKEKEKEKGVTRVLLKPAPTVVLGSPERAEGRTGKRGKVYLYGADRGGETGVGGGGGGDSANKNDNANMKDNANGNNTNTNAPQPTTQHNHNKRPSAPRMNAQRNPSMFGMELPRLAGAALAAASIAVATTPSSSKRKHDDGTRDAHERRPDDKRDDAGHKYDPKHKRTLSRESAGTTGSGSSAGGSSSSNASMRMSMVGSVSGGGGVLPPLCGDAALSVPPSPLTMGFAQEVRQHPHQHGRRASAELARGEPATAVSTSAVPVAAQRAITTAAPTTASPAAASATALSLTASVTASPAPARAGKTLRRVRHRLAPSSFGRRISFGSLLASVDDDDRMDVDVEADVDSARDDDRSFDLSGGRGGLGLGLRFGADEGRRGDGGGYGHGRGHGSVFGAVLGEAFSVKPRAVAAASVSSPDRERERAARRDRQKDKDKERTTARERTLGSAFRMA